MAPPRVSVIVPAFNAEPWIADALASILRQRFTDYEVLVVDDGSTDGTAAVVRRFPHPVRYLSQPHRGVASARNLGIGQSRGDLIAFLDADDLWLEEMLAAVVPCFDDPETALVSADTYRWDGRGPVEQSPRKWQRIRPPSAQDDLWHRMLRWNLFSSSTTVVRRAVLNVVGPLDERLTHSSDYDLWLRIIRAGYRVRALDRPLGVSRLHRANLTNQWGPQCDARLRVWRKLLALPDLTPQTRRRIRANRRTTAANLRRAAVRYVLDGDNGRARTYFGKACLHRPFTPRNYLGLLLTVVAPSAAVKAAHAGWLGRPLGEKR